MLGGPDQTCRSACICLSHIVDIDYLMHLDERSFNTDVVLFWTNFRQANNETHHGNHDRRAHNFQRANGTIEFANHFSSTDLDGELGSALLWGFEVLPRTCDAYHLANWIVNC